MPSRNVFNETITENLTLLCNALYFRLCIDLMHITPPVTAEGYDIIPPVTDERYDGSHHPRCAELEWKKCILSPLES